MAYKLADGSLSTDYKVGDEFIVGETSLGQTFGIGSIVKLYENDKTHNPLFKLVKGECLDSVLGAQRAYFNWDSLRAVKKKPFTKSDLKDGMRVEHKNGEIGYVCGDEILFPGDGGYNRANRYTDDLLDKMANGLVSSYAIIRVTDRDGTVLFEREPEKVKLELEVTPEQAEAIRKQLGQ